MIASALNSSEYLLLLISYTPQTLSCLIVCENLQSIKWGVGLNAIIQAANNAKAFGHSVSSNFKRIHLYTRFIRQYDEEVSSILSDMHELVNAYKDTEFVKQIHLIESFKGAGFLSAVSLTIIAVALIVLCFAVCFINLRLLMLG